MKSLKLTEFSDRELCFVIEDHADPEGFVTVAQIALALNLDHDHPHQCVASRFAWLQRYGVMERVRKNWRLTPTGRALMHGTLNKTQTNALENLKPEQLVIATRKLGERYRASGQVASTMMRREWTYGTRREKA